MIGVLPSQRKVKGDSAMKKDLVLAKCLLLSERRNKLIPIRLLVRPTMQRGKKIFGVGGDSRNLFFNKCKLYLVNNMNQLHKILVLLRTRILRPTILSNAGDFYCYNYSFFDGLDRGDTYFPETPTTTITDKTPKLEQLSIVAVDLSICEPSLSPSPIKRNRGDCPSTPVGKDSSKWVHFSEDSQTMLILLSSGSLFLLLGYPTFARNFCSYRN